MAEQGGERTEAPSQRRRQEAREQGRVPISMELSSVVLLLSAVLLLGLFGQGMIRQIAALLAQTLGRCGQMTLSMQTVQALLPAVGALFANILGPFFFYLALIAVVVDVLQHGFVFTLQPLQPHLNAPSLSPLRGLQQIFSLRSAVHFVFSIIKLVIIVRASVITFREVLPQVMGMMDMPVMQIAGTCVDILFQLVRRMAVLLLFVAVVDYAYQRWEYERNLRMTKEEVREEMRRMEGDPKIKARIRSVQMQMARKRMFHDVPQADVIITNPIHFAVAVKYDIDSMPAPKVLAKGARLVAQRIKEIAQQHNVPIVENKPLARALYKEVAVGGYIPAKLYQAVAEVLAYVYQINRLRYRSLSHKLSRMAA
ncbi:MAG: flagellar biosynthesis protein FlhB [Candidatus Omnitrophica bacterium]|nr:flagellar biosynthesis protein FlhB [Candidatus Omnitrophota bacterium]